MKVGRLLQGDSLSELIAQLPPPLRLPAGPVVTTAVRHGNVTQKHHGVALERVMTFDDFDKCVIFL